MSDENFLFDKPIGILAKRGPMEYCPDIEINIQFAQNGFKIRSGSEMFVAKTTDEVMDIVKIHMEKIIKEMKAADK